MHTFFNTKLTSGNSNESFLAFCDFEYSNVSQQFVNIFLKIEQQTKRKYGLTAETNNDLLKIIFTEL